MVEAKNQLDSLIYSTEKSMADLKDKLSPEDQGRINTALEDSKKALESNDADKIKAAQENLMKAAHKLSEEVYRKASGGGGTPGGGTSGGGGDGSAGKGEGAAKGEGVVDADFEEVRGDR
jgi:molecular chaperone DnaK